MSAQGFSTLEPTTIDGVRIRNRFARSATWDSSATDDGEVTDASVEIIERLARGGMGLIITGYAYVSEHGKAARRQLGISEDRHVEGLRRLAKAAHDHGACIAKQIAHGGINLLLLGNKDRVALAPSELPKARGKHRAMTAEEVDQIADDFASAAVRAREAGFDAVQLHGAHGYLITQFLSPLANLRTDEWGGSPEARRRLPVEVVRRVRRAVGDDFPVWIKLGARDYAEQGMTLSEGMEALTAMVAAGLSAVEISAGIGARSTRVHDPEDEERPYFRAESSEAKRAVDIPVMLVGGIRTLETAEEIVSSGDADMISMCRPLIREPDLIGRWGRGDLTPATCIRCNKCFRFGPRGEPLQCAQELELREGTSAE